MRSIAARLLPLLLFALAFVACDDDIPAAPKQSEVIVPLAVGNEWLGDQPIFDPQGGLIGMRTESIAISGEEMRDGERWFRNDPYSYTNRADGHWLSTSRYTRLMFKYPAEVGDTFGTLYLPALRDDGTPTGDTLIVFTEVVSTDRFVTVPAGSFTCYQYIEYVGYPDESPAAMGHKQSFLAPGKGYVKMETYASRDSRRPPYLQARWELIRLRLN